MRIRITSAARQAILDHTEREHPHEVCGLLVGSGMGIEEAIPATNAAANTHVCFEVDPGTLLRVHREARESGRSVLGSYHSHPGGRATPSPTDLDNMTEPGKLWLIVAEGWINAYQSRNGGHTPMKLQVKE